MRQIIPAVACVTLAIHAAHADRESLSLSLGEHRVSQPDEPPAQGGGGPETDPEAPLTLDLPSRRFGAPGGWYWSVGLTSAFAEDAIDARLDYTIRAFIAEDFEFDLSLAGWGFFQEGRDAAGVNPGIAFRWHFINDHDKGYSVYAQTGIGLLWATDETPDDGTRFNFTPHAGVGTTFNLNDSGARLDLGLGWHHISNASTSGSDDNPARDSLAVWVGVIFPF